MWRPVTKSKPCKICEKPDWCTFDSENGDRCCMRVESTKPMRNGGWLHSGNYRSIGVWRVPRNPEPMRPKLTSRQLETMNRRYQLAVNESMLYSWATDLGVCGSALDQLWVGWDGEATTFPMFNAAVEIVGIRRRFGNGKKLSVKGGREGIFGVQALRPGPLWIAEGASDTAYLLSIGLNAIGLPSCTGGVPYLEQICKGRQFPVTIVADNDEPGIRGALSLAKRIEAKVVIPPDGCKDVRQWRPTREELEKLS